MLYIKVLRAVLKRAKGMLVLALWLVWFVHIIVLLHLPVPHPMHENNPVHIYRDKSITSFEPLPGWLVLFTFKPF